MAQSSVKILTDENISPRLAQILYEVGHKSAYQFDRQFPSNKGVQDEYYLPEATKRNFVVLSCDRNMKTRPVVARFLAEGTARVIFLPSFFAQGAGGRLRDQLMWMLKYWPKIETIAETMQPGDIINLDRYCRSKPAEPLQLVLPDAPVAAVNELAGVALAPE